MDKKALVTGGAGFIGSALVRRLLKEQYEVAVFDDLSTGLRDNLPENTKLRFVQGDVRDFESVSSAIRKHSYVMHLAAQAFVPLSYQKPVQVAAVNALGSLNVFKACLDHGVKRLIHISSSEVYGTAQYTPMNEQHPLHPHSTYAVAKLTADACMTAIQAPSSHPKPSTLIAPFLRIIQPQLSQCQSILVNTRNETLF